MGPQLVLQESFVPDGPVGQFRAVMITDNENAKQADTAGAFVAGFCQDEINQDDQERGRLAAVRIIGVSRAVAAVALDAGQAVSVDGEGRVRPAQAGDFVIGRCVTPVTDANDWTSVLVTHEGQQGA